MSLIETIEDIYPEALLMDGYDDCIIGICERYGQPPIIAYDMDKVLLRLQSDGMSRQDAVEYFEYNQIGAWMGDRTPCFIDRLED